MGTLNGGKASGENKLGPQIPDRWIQYLKDPNKDHPYVKGWYRLKNASLADVEKAAADFQALAVSIFDEKKAIDDRNYVKLGGAKGAKDEKTRQYTNLESLPIEKYYVWRDLASEPYMRNGLVFPGGIYYFGLTSTLKRDFEVRGGEMPEAKDIDRFLDGEWKDYLNSMRADLAQLKKNLAPTYPFLHAIRDSAKPANARVAIRGDAENLGEEAPRHFLSILSNGKPELFTKRSGRLQFAEDIASPDNPLTARVIVNRIWDWYFGHGIVGSPSNFGVSGDRPSHPELLDFLAARRMEHGWSIKTLQREIMLSAVYSLSSQDSELNAAKDPENRLLWRGEFRVRLDAELCGMRCWRYRASIRRKAGRLSHSFLVRKSSVVSHQLSVKALREPLIQADH